MPYFVGGIGVPTIKEGGIGLLHDQAGRRNGVVDKNRGDVDAGEGIGRAGFEVLRSQYRVLCSGDGEEVRVHIRIEDVAVQALYDFSKPGHDNRSAGVLADIVCQSGKSFDVIEMEMRKDDVTNLFLLAEGKCAGNRPGVEKQGAIQEDAAGVAGEWSVRVFKNAIGSMTAQYFDIHV